MQTPDEATRWAEAPPGRFRVTLQFDQPVDAVAFASVSAFRKRVSCVVDRTGASAEKTGDGRPQLHLQPRL